MASWSVILRSDPPLGFYRPGEALGEDTTETATLWRWPRLLEVSDIRRAIRYQGGENASARVTLDNGDGALTPLMADLPLLAECSIYRDAAEVFRGRVRRVRLNGAADLELEA